jgi:hypothetical protein
MMVEASVRTTKSSQSTEDSQPLPDSLQENIFEEAKCESLASRSHP